MDPKPHFEAPLYKPAGKLEGKVAIVTGGDSGIGRAVAVMFAREGADAIILGGTELPLILTGDDLDGVPMIDTTGVHVRAIVEELAR